MQRLERNRGVWRGAISRRFGRRSRLLGSAIALLLVGGITATVLGLGLHDREAPPTTLSYTDLLRGIETGQIAELVVRPGMGAEGRWVADARPPHEGERFRVVLPPDAGEAVAERAAAAGVEVRFVAPPDRDRLRNALALLLQGLVIGGFLYLVIMQLRTQGGNAKAARRPDGSVTTFADVAGTQGAAEELREIVEFLKRPAAFAAMGARVPKGVLLAGPPGTGKTLLARAVAGEAGVPFFAISGSEVTGFLVGLGAHRIRSLFRKARRRGGVIFIDELDVLGGRRGRNQSHNEDDRTLNQLLVEMDGFAPSEGVVVIGATNRPDELDPALKRPGRFDRLVAVPLPTVDGREAILRLHATRRAMPLAPDADLARLARLTPGASGAELEALLNEAAIAAVREGAQEVAWRHFEAARDRLLLGKERVGFRARDHEWRVVAYHEAGHALAGLLACPEDELHKVTIQPRGQAMGVAHFSPEDDRNLYSRRYLEGQIVKGLGGRVAEELVFGPEHVTSGAESDLVQVNRIARRMVYRLGMGEGTGLLVADEAMGPLSSEARARMEEEVRRLLDRLYARTRELLSAHRAALDALAAALLARETIEGEEVERILEAHGVKSAAITAG
jgi:cell division protease FtsH